MLDMKHSWSAGKHRHVDSWKQSNDS